MAKRTDGRPARSGRGLFHRPRPRVRPGRRTVQAAGLARPWTSELTVFGGAASAAVGLGLGPLGGTGPGCAAWSPRSPRGCRLVRHRVPGPGPTVDGSPADAVVLAMPGLQARRLVDDRSPAALLDGRECPAVRRRRMGPAGMATDDRARQRPFRDLARRRRRRLPGRRCAGTGRAQRLRRRRYDPARRRRRLGVDAVRHLSACGPTPFDGQGTAGGIAAPAGDWTARSRPGRRRWHGWPATVRQPPDRNRV